MKIGDIISLLRLIAYVIFEVLKAIKPRHKNNRPQSQQEDGHSKMIR